LQTDGVEIQNMAMLQQMGFEITRTHTGEYKISKDSQITGEALAMMNSGMGGINGRGNMMGQQEENKQNFGQEPKNSRPSDIGGTGQGSPSSGSGTSMSKKSGYPDGITPKNFQVIKSTLQTAVDFQWNKTKTVEELRKYGMTVRQARELVKNEFQGMRRWEDE
jgi:hypothetical protein